MKQTFQGSLRSKGPGGAWTFMDVPPAVSQAFGIKGRIPVIGTVNGFAFQNSFMPNGDGTHSMMFSKALQTGAKAGPGEHVKVVVELDTAPRQIATPDDLRRALVRHKGLVATFDALAHSHRKEFIDWIESAKRPETREARIAKTVEWVAAGRKSRP
jgi:hypothetical protein